MHFQGNFTVLSLLALLTMTLTQPASADVNSCLRQVSNRDLLREVAARMSSVDTPAASESFILTATCAGNAEIQLATTSLGSGRGSKASLQTASWENCRNVAKAISDTFGSRPASGGRIFASCAGNAEVMRVLVQNDGQLKSLDAISTTSWENCRTMAAQMNEAALSSK